MVRSKSLHLVIIITLVKVNLTKHFNCGQKNGKEFEEQGNKANWERKEIPQIIIHVEIGWL